MNACTGAALPLMLSGGSGSTLRRVGQVVARGAGDHDLAGLRLTFQA